VHFLRINKCIYALTVYASMHILATKPLDKAAGNESSLVPQEQAEGWQLTRVCSVKHQKQLSGGQGPRSEKQLEWTRTAPVAPKSQLPCRDRIQGRRRSALLKSPVHWRRAFWNACLKRKRLNPTHTIHQSPTEA
jgi:hypothetical protein